MFKAISLPNAWKIYDFVNFLMFFYFWIPIEKRNLCIASLTYLHKVRREPVRTYSFSPRRTFIFSLCCVGSGKPKVAPPLLLRRNSKTEFSFRRPTKSTSICDRCWEKRRFSNEIERKTGTPRYVLGASAILLLRKLFGVWFCLYLPEKLVLSAIGVRCLVFLCCAVDWISCRKYGWTPNSR